MISTSEQWKEIFNAENVSNNLLPECNVNIVNNDNVLDTTGFNVISTDKTSFSNITNFAKNKTSINRDEKKIATLEWNFWALDGSYIIPDDDTEVDRFVSKQICDENGYFTTSNPIDYDKMPSIKISYSSEFATGDFYTLKFAPYLNEYATDFIIKADRGNEWCFVDDNDEQYISRKNTLKGATTYITLYIYKWSMPYRRARVSEFLSGLRIFFEKSNLTKFKHQRTTDMVSASLPQNDCDFSILDINCDWDIDNPKAKFAKMVNATSIFNLYYGYKINDVWEWIEADRLVLESLERPANGLEANFSLESSLNRKIQTFFNTDEDNNNYKWESYNQLLPIIGQKGNFAVSRVGGNFATDIRFGLKNLTQGNMGSAYYEKTMKEWLQLVAATINAFILRNPNGSFTVKGLVNTSGKISNTSIVDTLTLERCFEYPEVEHISEIGKIILTIGRAIGATTKDPDKKYEVETGGVTTVFPPYRYTKTFGSGVEQTADNQLIVYGASAGDGNAFVPSDGVHTSYMNFLYTFISGARRIKANCIINPAWQVGDLISMELKDGSLAKGFIIDIDIEFSGYAKGNVTILAPKSLNN